ncbi:MAG TPA: site-specific DNA-methyltransferase [Nitrososphaerales archaeon]|nr:site-specific DNA-methyltransferase [Nitrososphaerales archaeon]
MKDRRRLGTERSTEEDPREDHDTAGGFTVSFRRSSLSSKIEKFWDRVYNEDVIELLRKLPSNSIDCVYADPDYNVGVKYNNISYKKKFDDYISWCVEWSKEALRVLKPEGNFFVINYPKNNAYLRTRYLDDAFCDVNEYVWVYNTNIGHSGRRFTTAHRSILHCTKSKQNKFYLENVAVGYQNPNDRRIRKLLEEGAPGRMPYSWLYYDLVKNVGVTKTFHSCQIPEKLSHTLIASCTQPGDAVLILFGGSGSEIIECKKMQRHYIAAEIDRKYFKLIEDRLKQADGKVPYPYRLMNRIQRNRNLR